MPDKKIKNPGAKGGKYYINSKGNVVYGEKPHGEHPDYDPKKDFKAQFPSFEDFQKLAQQHGLPDISIDDYKKLYQTEHKAYMKTVKESGTKELKGFSGEKQVEFLKNTMFLNENGEYVGLTVKQALEQAEKEGIEVSADEAMKFYKKVKYDEKKIKEGKIKPPGKKPDPEPKIPSVKMEDGTEILITDKLPEFAEYHVKMGMKGYSGMATDYYLLCKEYYEKGGTNGLTAVGKKPEFNANWYDKGDYFEYPSYQEVLDAYVKNGFTLSFKEHIEIKKVKVKEAEEKKKIEDEEKAKKDLSDEASANDFLKNNYPIFDKTKGAWVDPSPNTDLNDEAYVKYLDKFHETKQKINDAVSYNKFQIAKDEADLEKNLQDKANSSQTAQEYYKHYTDIYDLPLKLKHSSIPSEVGAIMQNVVPEENVGKIVFWQHSPTSEKWEAGEIVGYNPLNDEYMIKATSNGYATKGTIFYKSRPHTSIVEAVEKKVISPQFKPSTGNKDFLQSKENPKMTVEEAKKFLDSNFENLGFDKRTGVTINHDSILVENDEFRFRYNEVDGEYKLEFKLRNPEIKKEIYDNMKKQNGSFKKQKIYNGYGTSGNLNTFQVRTKSLFCSVPDGQGNSVKMEYGAVSNADGYSKSGDVGWTIKDNIVISVNKVNVNSAGDAYEKMVNAMKGIISKDSGEKLFEKPSEESLRKIKMMNVINYIDPSWNELGKGYTGKIDEISVADLEAKLKKELGAKWESKIDYIETSKGHNSYIIKDYHKELEKKGLKYIYTSVGSGYSGVDNFISAFQLGAVSINERHKSGFVGDSSSGNSDYHSGGAEYLFTRMVTEKNMNKQTFHSPNVSGNVNIIFKNEVVNRTDSFGYNADSYGSTLPYNHEDMKALIADDFNTLAHYGVNNYTEKLTPLSMASKSLNANNEVMYKKGVSPAFIDKVVVHTTKDLEYLHSSLQKKGITHHPDGRLITDCIHYTKDMAYSAVENTITLTEYLANPSKYKNSYSY